MFRTTLLVSSLLLLAPSAWADSMCWPQEKLLNTQAVGGYWAHEKSFAVYPSQEAKAPQEMSCSQLETVGACEADTAFIPVWAVEGDLLQIKLKSGDFAWLKPTPRDAGWGYWTTDAVKAGTLMPLGTPFLTEPTLTAAPVTLDHDKIVAFYQNHFEHLDTLEYLLENHIISFLYEPTGSAKTADGTFIQANARVFTLKDGGPEIIQGDIVGRGYFRHRSGNNELTAVLSAAWCD